MQAYAQIIKQLISEIDTARWSELTQLLHFSEAGQLYDLCLFSGGNSQKKYGLAWISFPSKTDYFLLPFCLSRYEKHFTDLIHKYPWSLKEASCDPYFYSAWNHSLNHESGIHVRTMLGNIIASHKALGTPHFAPEKIQSDLLKSDILLRSEETIKFLKWVSLSENAVKDIEILDFLTHNPSSHFENFPKLIESFHYLSLSRLSIPFAYTVQSLNHLSKISDTLRECTTGNSASCKKLMEKIGRVLAEFHKTMLNARNHTGLAPVSVAKETFLETFFPKKETYKTCFQKLETKVLTLLKNTELPTVLIAGHGNLQLKNILSNHDDVYLTGFTSSRANTSKKVPFFKDLSAFLFDFRMWYFETSPISENNEKLDELENAFKSGYRKNLLEEPHYAQLLPHTSVDFEILVESGIVSRAEDISEYKSLNPKPLNRLVDFSDLQLTRLQR